MSVASASAPLSHLSRYIYGTTRLGHADNPLETRLAIARTALATGAWFHTSDQYDNALDVLAQVFDEDRTRVPPMIFKAGGNDAAELRAKITSQLERVGIARMDVAQLCFGGPLGEELAAGGPIISDLHRLRDEGRVGRYLLEVFPWTSAAPLRALEAGHLDGLVDGMIFYLNPLQRFASNALWDAIQAHDFPVVAMRTVCGAPVHRLRDVPGAAWTPYLQERATEVAPLFERSGVSDWTEFCVRFALGFKTVAATVGSTSRADNLAAFVHAVSPAEIAPLPADIQADLTALQRRWSDQVDIHAEPWSM
ncbi:hypothetical protein [Synoicihabitans lomoniglobus]|uniref:NADP-dependent oxidoreductase domain-containing protein n=1 Tax=Synoicihabitans lomoniglobus TaxID=2909285 RepID=A0AAF0I4S9_9BACT|nr:hypothetical protein [Opitutaceae bacterium LMO-M01]WED67003.1 hypothetical protein PXH66_09085 [Opitutaceae bacterium LMO-M01]